MSHPEPIEPIFQHFTLTSPLLITSVISEKVEAKKDLRHALARPFAKKKRERERTHGLSQIAPASRKLAKWTLLKGIFLEDLRKVSRSEKITPLKERVESIFQRESTAAARSDYAFFRWRWRRREIDRDGEKTTRGVLRCRSLISRESSRARARGVGAARVRPLSRGLKVKEVEG